MSGYDYTFEMHEARQVIFNKIAEVARECDTVTDLKLKRMYLKRIVRRTVKPKKKSSVKVAEEFETSFKNAIDIVRGKEIMEIQECSGILTDHDGEIAPSEIEGSFREIITTKDGSETKIYPVVEYDAEGEGNYRICTCPAQKYQLICKHTIARIIERNLRSLPNST